MNQRGFAHLILVIILAAGIFAAAGFAFWNFQTRSRGHQAATSGQVTTTPSNQTCSNQLPNLQTPVDLTKVTGILYPGQYRGDQYKAHGGFRFDQSQPEDITVKAPLDANIVRASRYIQSGDIQLLLEFENACHIGYRFDHILTLAPKFAAVFNSFPPPTADSHGTALNPPVPVKAGEVIATAVGSPKTGNVFVDFGVYDLQHKNAASGTPGWDAKHANQPNDAYGLCWFGLLPSSDAAKVKSLPSASRESGTQSDYCK